MVEYLDVFLSTAAGSIVLLVSNPLNNVLPEGTCNNTSVPTETIILEGESADKIIGYRLENIETAFGGIALNLVGMTDDKSGSASFPFGDTPDELTGTYDVTIGTFNEADATVSFTLEVAKYLR
ncbi:MAG: hypothetical protein ACFB0E_06695 [Leptolyngbyaceae cyanobacterium]